MQLREYSINILNGNEVIKLSEIILELNSVSKYYNKYPAISDIDFSVRKGDIIGIAGPNGAGKTTLLKVIAGLIPKYKGNLSLFGSQSSRELTNNRYQVGAIIEAPAFFPNLTARQNLSHFAIQRSANDSSRIEEVLKLVNLTDTGNKKFKNFSLGMKQRLGIALTLLHRPHLLILDEPINGLDPEGIVQLRQMFKQLVEKEKMTLIISSHILSELESLATHFLIIDHGKIIDQFTHEELNERKKPVINLKTNDPQKTQELIRTHFPTITIEVLNGQMQLSDMEVAAHEINQLLVSNQIQVDAIYRQVYPLEEMFMDILHKNRQSAETTELKKRG